LRFLLYTIRYATGHRGRFHFPFPYAGYLRRSRENFAELAEFIASGRLDAMGLVEVDGGSFRTGQRCQASMIARQQGYY